METEKLLCSLGINPLNAELNPICHLLALLGAHHILHIGRIRVKECGISVTTRIIVDDKACSCHLTREAPKRDKSYASFIVFTCIFQFLYVYLIHTGAEIVYSE